MQVTAPKKAALYVRVSTTEGRQHVENQVQDLKQFAAGMGWTVLVPPFHDSASGAKATRPGLDALMEAAERREFDLVLVWDLSRLTRGGILTAFQVIERLEKCRVEFWSYREPQFRTAGEAGKLFIAVAAYLAKQEREQLQERIQAGIRSARGRGVQFGPPRRVIDIARARELAAAGQSYRQIAAALGCGKTTIEKRLKDGKGRP